MLEMRTLVTLRGEVIKTGLWGTENILFLNLGADNMGVVHVRFVQCPVCSLYLGTIYTKVTGYIRKLEAWCCT